MSAAFPSPDATPAEIEAWKLRNRQPRPRCKCGHSAMNHDHMSSTKCLFTTCGCSAYTPRARKVRA